MFDVPQISRAWMDLAPPVEGMVLRTTLGKRCVVRAHDVKVAGSWYPDPVAWANWGVWHQYAHAACSGVTLGHDGVGWVAEEIWVGSD